MFEVPTMRVYYQVVVYEVDRFVLRDTNPDLGSFSFRGTAVFVLGRTQHAKKSHPTPLSASNSSLSAWPGQEMRISKLCGAKRAEGNM